jgi:hypothetical protein
LSRFRQIQPQIFASPFDLEHPESSPTMSSQRSRAPRNGVRGDSQDGINKKEMWDEVKRLLSALKAGEREAALHNEKILASEERLNAKKNTAEGIELLILCYS